MKRARRFAAAVAVVAAVVSAPGCSSEPEAPRLPTASELEGLYGDRAAVTREGNVVNVEVEQPARQLARGGRLWAKVGPYIYLFSPQTRELFASYSGLAAVRARTVNEAGDWIAQATLRHDALNPLTWDDARRVVARARQQGTDKPGYLEDLIRFGEEHADFRYNESFLQR